MKDDYGYFGTGTTGYAHYMQAFERSFGRADDVTYETETDDMDIDKMDLEDDEIEGDDESDMDEDL